LVAIASISSSQKWTGEREEGREGGREERASGRREGGREEIYTYRSRLRVKTLSSNCVNLLDEIREGESFSHIQTYSHKGREGGREGGREALSSRTAPVWASKRLVAIASISSMKIMEGEFSRASRKTSRTIRGPSPRYFCTNSELGGGREEGSEGGSEGGREREMIRLCDKVQKPPLSLPPSLPPSFEPTRPPK